MDASIEGRRFLVTGASGGIGQEIARAFATEAADVVLHCRSNRRAVDELHSKLGTATEVVAADLTREGEVDAMYATILASRRDLAGIVVNAGVWEPNEVPVHAMSLEQWDRTIANDLTSAFLTCRGYLRYVERERPDTASIVLIGSTAGLFGEENHADYSAAKAAMTHGLTASLKNEIVRSCPRGRVNCVCPGWVMTPMVEKTLDDTSVLATATATVAMRKVARPEDIAHATVWLSSDRLSGHVSGTIVPVHGGMEGRLLHR